MDPNNTFNSDSQKLRSACFCSPVNATVMMNKIDKIKKIADIKIEKRGKKWLVN